MTPTKHHPQPARRLLALAALTGSLLLMAAGCASHIGADLASPRRAYLHLHEDALSSNEVSNDTAQVLQRYDLAELFSKDPDQALTWLHEKASNDGRRDLLHALSELNYARGEALRLSVKPWEKGLAQDHYLASAIYAYFYLFSDGPEKQPNPFELSAGRARELYNRGLALGLSQGDPKKGLLKLQSDSRQLAAGSVELAFKPSDVPWNPEWLEEYYAADNYIVHGLSTRNRTSGFGAPLIAVLHEPGEVLPTHVPLTVFLRVRGDIHSWGEEPLATSLELYHGIDVKDVPINGKSFPLQTDTTAPLAFALNNEFLWKLGLSQFLSPEQNVKKGIINSQHYVRGRIPVVFVHGTASSPVWWAEMLNSLRSDVVLQKRYQCFAFNYNSGSPLSYSAGLLRKSLTNIVETYDPEGKEPALRQMVVIGHSQGGLLTKLTATDTGDKLWRIASDKDPEELSVSKELQESLRETFFQTPLPCVKRVVFIATPHRGSFLATRFVRNVLHHLVSLPAEVTQTTTSLLLQLNKETRIRTRLGRRVPNSVDSMSPKNKFLTTLAGIPVADGVKAHSIIAIKGDDQPPEGSDGVVEYQSAHVDYADSEFIVRSGHTCQNHPFTIEEVRRILLEHLRELSEDKSSVQQAK